MLYQAEMAECGLTCLAMILAYHGRNVDATALRQQHPVSMRGLSLAALKTVAESHGFAGRAVRIRLDELQTLRTPAVLHWDLNHFVVLENARAGAATILDPALGRRRLKRPEMSRHFSGVALELWPAARLAANAPAPRLSLTHFILNIQGTGAALFYLLLLSAALQAFLLVTPFYAQLVIDDVVLSGDTNLLLLLGIAFAGLAAFSAITSGFRAWLIVFIGSTLNMSWSSALFHHLVRLPCEFFERRQVGDIQSRFRSLSRIRELVTTDVVEAIIDGTLTVTTLVVMGLYSPTLSALVVASVFLYVSATLALFRPLRSASREALIGGARQDAVFLETLRGILPIKNAGRESQRRSLFDRRTREAVSATANVDRYRIIGDVAGKILFGVQNVVVVWLGALQIVEGAFTIGMLIAFLAYKAQFTGRATALVDRLFQFRLTRIHLDRLADIVGTRIEVSTPKGPVAQDARSGLAGSLRARKVSFRYGANEADVLAEVDLSIAEGEHVAIAGPSGAGKSTLLKILVGLLRPTTGDLFVDHRPLRPADLAWYRRHIAVVLQNDLLLSGSLLDNICLFAEEPDEQRADECCRIAGIRREILRMPLGYRTPVGDMGSALSGGQQQRILLARALYRKPRILFLDEATSHLDAEAEKRVTDSIASLDITRVHIAHRRETLMNADRIIMLAAPAGA